MPPLIVQLREFLSWLQEHTLVGFKTYAEQLEDYSFTPDIFDGFTQLLYYSEKLKVSVRENNKDKFAHFKASYLRLYDRINTDVAEEYYDHILQKYLDQGHKLLDAEVYAVEEVWKEHAMRYWLPASVEMKDHQGRKVFLIANKKHIPPESPYVLTSELASLEKAGRSPWEYVNNRKAQ